MVKIRIHELAKELGKNSKEVIEFLKTKNIEAANHMSTLTEEEAAMVRKGLAGKGSGEVHKKTKVGNCLSSAEQFSAYSAQKTGKTGTSIRG